MVRHGVIYGLLDVAGVLRYIGQTTKADPLNRLASHLAPSSLRKHSYLARWLKGMIDRGERPRMVLFAEAGTQAELDRLEQEWIAAARAAGVRLVNMNDGGGGKFGYVPTAAEREKIAAAQRGVPRPYAAKPRTEEVKAKISAGQTGVPKPSSRFVRSEEMRRKMSAAQKGKPRPSARRKRRPEEVEAYSAPQRGKPRPQTTGERHGCFDHSIKTADIVALLRSGASVEAVGAAIGRSRTFVSRRLKQEGLTAAEVRMTSVELAAETALQEGRN